MEIRNSDFPIEHTQSTRLRLLPQLSALTDAILASSVSLVLFRDTETWGEEQLLVQLYRSFKFYLSLCLGLTIFDNEFNRTEKKVTPRIKYRSWFSWFCSSDFSRLVIGQKLKECLPFTQTTRVVPGPELEIQTLASVRSKNEGEGGGTPLDPPLPGVQKLKQFLCAR